MGVHGEAWTGASQKTFSKGNKCQNPCFLFCFVSSFLLIIYFRATLLKFFPVSLWPSDSSPSKHHMSIFLDSVSSKSWMLNFLEQKAEEVKKAHFSPQFMTPCRKTAKLLIGLLYPPNRKISKCDHVPVSAPWAQAPGRSWEVLPATSKPDSVGPCWDLQTVERGAPSSANSHGLLGGLAALHVFVYIQSHL